MANAHPKSNRALMKHFIGGAVVEALSGSMVLVAKHSGPIRPRSKFVVDRIVFSGQRLCVVGDLAREKGNLFMLKWLMVALVSCSTVSLSRAVDKICIDNFCDGNPDLTKWSPGSAETTEVGLFEVMGGERFSRIEITSLTESSASVRIEPTGGCLLLSSDAGVVAEWSLIYGKNNDLNKDLGGGDDTVFVEWAGWTDDKADVTVILLNDNDGDAQQAQVTKTTLGGPACQIMEFTFAQFKLNNPLMAFDDIDRVTFFVEGRPGWDGQMAFMVPLPVSPHLPEPATMSLLALGGIALLRRRRNKG